MPKWSLARLGSPPGNSRPSWGLAVSGTGPSPEVKEEPPPGKSRHWKTSLLPLCQLSLPSPAGGLMARPPSPGFRLCLAGRSAPRVWGSQPCLELWLPLLKTDSCLPRHVLALHFLQGQGAGRGDPECPHGLLRCPFIHWGDWGSERGCDLPKVSEPAK